MDNKMDGVMEEPDSTLVERSLVQFKNDKGEDIGNQFELPLNINRRKLQILYNAIFNKDDPEPTPYLFYLNEFEIKDTLSELIETNFKEEFDSEKVLQITCLPQACYRVESVTRCSSSIAGHSDAILSVAFNNDGTKLASGSGDTTVRFWDVQTQTAHFTGKAHRNWVLVIAWSPDGKRLASACKNGEICIWDPNTGQQIGRTLRGHSKWINSMAWEPFHRNPECRRLASASKDCTIRVWDTVIGSTLFTLSSHTMSVTSLKWGGTGLLYSSSQDRTIKIWNDGDGTLKQTLTGHAHWVNTLALSTDYALRLGSFDPEKQRKKEQQPDGGENLSAAAQNALAIYEKARAECERLVSGSDDFTLHLWTPETSGKPVARLTGHLQLVNDVKFSPDARLLASASFDKSIKLWDGKTGKFITTLRGHVSRVYQLSWSSDSRLLVSGSADSTLKVWSIKNQKLWNDLPGHLDEVYAVDWSPNGEHVSSGGKDKLMKIWRK